MRSTVGIPLLPAQAVAEGQGGGGCQLKVFYFALRKLTYRRLPLGTCPNAV